MCPQSPGEVPGDTSPEAGGLGEGDTHPEAGQAGELAVERGEAVVADREVLLRGTPREAPSEQREEPGLCGGSLIPGASGVDGGMG